MSETLPEFWWSTDYTFNICLFQHEAWTIWEEWQAAVDRIITCPLREWWKNLLCNHPVIYQKGVNQLQRLIEKSLENITIEDFVVQDIVNRYNSIRVLKLMVDNMQRASHLKWIWTRERRNFPLEGVWVDIHKYLDEWEGILDRCFAKVEQEPEKRLLNQWERTRFNFLIGNIQKIIQGIIEWIRDELWSYEKLKEAA